MHKFCACFPTQVISLGARAPKNIRVIAFMGCHILGRDPPLGAKFGVTSKIFVSLIFSQHMDRESQRIFQSLLLSYLDVKDVQKKGRSIRPRMRYWVKC